MKLLVTGATGYIGQQLTSLAAATGHEVICATRQPCSPAYKWLAYDLLGPAPDCPAGVQAIIHLAADTSTGGHIGADDEIKAAQALILCAQQSSARFIFISSQTAEATAASAYGRTKWRIEQEVLAAGGVVIRPGQVYGGPERGLFGTLSGMVRRFPVIPILLPAPFVQPIHVDDLSASILAVAERDDIRGETFSLGAVQPVSFGRFLTAIAAYRVNTIRLPVPLPVAFLKILGLLLGQSLSAKLGLERIFSLISLKYMETECSLKKLGIELRSLAHGMHRSGRGQRRQLLQEAVVLLSYLLKKPPPRSLASRYVRALERSGRTRPVIESRVLMRWPILLTLLDNHNILTERRGLDLCWRLQVALNIAEASPLGAKTFLGSLEQRNPVIVLIGLGLISAKELLWRTPALLCRPLVRKLFLGSEALREA